MNNENDNDNQDMVIKLCSDFKRIMMRSYENGLTSEQIQKVIIDILAMNSLILWGDLHVYDEKKETQSEQRWCQDNFIWQTLNCVRNEMFLNFFQANEGI